MLCLHVYLHGTVTICFGGLCVFAWFDEGLIVHTWRSGPTPGYVGPLRQDSTGLIHKSVWLKGTNSSKAKQRILHNSYTLLRR